MKHLSLLLLSFFALNASAQVTPAPEQTEAILITGATAHLGNGKVIQNAAIGFDGGKLNYVGTVNGADASKYKQIVVADGKHVYPGFIIPDITIGIFEIGAVRATQDNREVGGWNPHVRSIIAYNTDSRITPTVRSNGVLMAQITPQGGTISGTSSVVELDAWNWEDAVFRLDDGIHMNWPRLRKSWWNRDQQQSEVIKKYNENLNRIEDFFTEAAAYAKSELQAETDLKLDACRGLFDGSKTLYVHADYVKELTNIVKFKKDHKIENLVIVGGYDSWMITDLLKENNIGVMLIRTHSLPDRAEEDIDLPFKLPSLLQKGGVKWCLTYSGDMEAMGCRNLPFSAGTAAAYGLTKEEALMGITSNTADLLGIGDKVGTLEVGKAATLFISEGDALDMMTNDVTSAWISGRNIDLNNEQKDLYNKYKAKYGQE